MREQMPVLFYFVLFLNLSILWLFWLFHLKIQVYLPWKTQLSLREPSYCPFDPSWIEEKNSRDQVSNKGNSTNSSAIKYSKEQITAQGFFIPTTEENLSPRIHVMPSHKKQHSFTWDPLFLFGVYIWPISTITVFQRNTPMKFVKVSKLLIQTKNE